MSKEVYEDHRSKASVGSKRSLREWDLFQLRLARQYSTMSKDPGTRVGAGVTDKYSKHVYGLGYNGFPKEVEDTPERLNDRTFKLTLIQHVEKNALERAMQAGLLPGGTLFVYPFLPCQMCARSFTEGWYSSSDIKRVVTLDYVPDRWRRDFEESEALLLKAGITVVKYPVEELNLAKEITNGF